jgi:predicted PurR-regulated permease PerM
MVITAFIPLIGTPVVWVPAGLSLILGGNTARGIGLLVFGATIVMNIDNFLRPRLMSGRTKIHPVLILIGVMGG